MITEASDAMQGRQFILTLSGPSRMGIVYEVSKFLFERECTITDSAQFDDVTAEQFFMRVAFERVNAPIRYCQLTDEFTAIASRLNLNWAFADQVVRPKVAILVSKFDHCLRDLLYRQSVGDLNIDIPYIISNHPDAHRVASEYGVSFLHWPVIASDKASQEAHLLQLVRNEKIDLLVLARYVQIFSRELCLALPCPAINIHHSFLPSFKGANPYHQAHGRGVKIIGATAHYVTADLDEGPIIEQDVERVTHSSSPEVLVSIGRDIEKIVLFRAVRLHTERRILVNGLKTVVFS